MANGLFHRVITDCGFAVAFTSIRDFSWICLKCDPDRIVELRERYADIDRATHMDSRHWITVRLRGATCL